MIVGRCHRSCRHSDKCRSAFVVMCCCLGNMEPCAKKKLGVLTFMVCFLPCNVFFGYCETSIVISELETKVTGMSDRLSWLKSLVDGLNNNYALVKSKVKEMSEAVDALKVALYVMNTSYTDDMKAIKRTQEEILRRMLTISEPTGRKQPSSIIKQGEERFRVVCYYTYWAANRPKRHLPEDINPSLCTHVNYAFAAIDNDTLKLTSASHWEDLESKFYERVNLLKLKNPRLKVLLSVGGWIDNDYDKYSRLVSNSASRKEFAEHAATFLKQHGFDGLNLQWIFPACKNFFCERSPKEDKDRFQQWVEDLRSVFDRQNPRILLTASVSQNTWAIDAGYDVPALAKSVDFLNVMTYDYHGDWDGRTGPPSPLYYVDPEGGNRMTMNSSMAHWVHRGAPSEKLVMELQGYGRTFTLLNKEVNGPGAPAKGPGQEGRYSKESGRMAYYEICDRIKNQGWTKRVDKEIGPYIYQGDQWIGYDNPESLTQKARFVVDNGCGGVGLWDTSMDDYDGSCCKVKYPLLNAVNHVLRDSGTAADDLECE